MIELVLVMAIISILSVIFIPKYSDTLDELRLLNCSDKIIDDLKLIYNQAIVQHDSTWFVADTSANTYGIYSGSSALTSVVREIFVVCNILLKSKPSSLSKQSTAIWYRLFRILFASPSLTASRRFVYSFRISLKKSGQKFLPYLLSHFHKR